MVKKQHRSAWSMSSSSSTSYSAWQWTSCGLHPRTLSFRQEQEQEQQEEEEDNNDSRHVMAKHHQQAYNYYSSVDSVCTASSDAEAAEAIIRAVRSDRLLFEPDEDDVSSLMTASCKKPLSKKQAVDVEDDDDKQEYTTATAGTMSKAAATAAFGGAMAMSVESEDPYRDFRESMEAMVMSQQQLIGVKDDWCWLEEMLGWYLRANANTAHGLIAAAFVDLLVSLTSTTTADSSSSSSPATPDCDCERTSSF